MRSPVRRCDFACCCQTLGSASDASIVEMRDSIVSMRASSFSVERSSDALFFVLDVERGLAGDLGRTFGFVFWGGGDLARSCLLCQSE